MKLNTKVTIDVVQKAVELLYAAEKALGDCDNVLKELLKLECSEPEDLHKEWKALQDLLKNAAPSLINARRVARRRADDLDLFSSNMDE
jgi:hypothetical protein